VDANDILLWMVGIGMVLSFVRQRRAAYAEGRGWLAVYALVFAVAVVSYLAVPAVAGYVGAALWALLVGIPVFGSRRLGRLTGTQQYGRARRLSQVLGFLHPLDGWPQHSDLYRALEAAQEGDRAKAIAILETVAASRSPSMRRQAAFNLFRLKGEWSELLSWMEKEPAAKQYGRDPVLLLNYLRALGETGHLDRLLSVFAENLPSLEQPGLVTVRGMGYLYAFAFSGRPEQTAHVLGNHLKFYGTTLRDFWLATAEYAAGNAARVRERLEELARHPDVMVARGAQDRLSRPIARASEGLTPPGQEILGALDKKLTLEMRHAEGAPGGRPVATWTLALLNLAVFGIEVLAGGSDDPATLYRLGAPSSQSLGLAESWRLVASLFLHLGPVHLVLNLLALLAVGPFLERALGTRRYLTIYLSSGLLAALVVLEGSSVLTPERPTFLVGASGCIMGLIGGTAAVLLRAWRTERAPPTSRRLRAIAVIVVLQVVFDLVIPQVSLATHLMGLVIGFVVAALGHFPFSSRKR
jgi:rhomboid protease GluP